MNEQPDNRETLWINDAELIRRLGVPEKIARRALRDLDDRHKQTGFPQKQGFWGDRRYWPAVKTWLDKHNGITMDALETRRAS